MTFTLTVFLAFPALAHEGHDHGPVPGESAALTGPITLPEEAIKNLGVESVVINLAPLQRTLDMVARIEALPEKQAQISAKFEGRVLEILVKLGAPVTKGQPLLKLDPTQIGNPPVLLRSPLDGLVVRQNLALGQFFNPETILMEVADYHQVLARGMTFESADLARIKIGQSAKVRVDVYPDQSFSGTVQRADVALERESKTFEIFVLLNNLDLKLRPNLQASLALSLGEVQEILAVPQRALLGDLGSNFVFVQEGNTFQKRPVVLGIKSGDQVEVLEGVFPGERVVIQGNYQLQYATGLAKNETQSAKETLPKDGLSTGFWIVGGLLLLVTFGVIVFRRFRRT